MKEFEHFENKIDGKEPKKLKENKVKDLLETYFRSKFIIGVSEETIECEICCVDIMIGCKLAVLTCSPLHLNHIECL